MVARRAQVVAACRLALVVMPIVAGLRNVHCVALGR
jgi:hypothetical protein